MKFAITLWASILTISAGIMTFGLSTSYFESRTEIKNIDTTVAGTGTCASCSKVCAPQKV